MTAKNALLFFLAVFGILFIGVDACLPTFGLANLQGAMSYIGGGMLVIFLLVVLGVGFVLRMAYLAVTCGFVAKAFDLIFLQQDQLIMGIVCAAVSFVLLALIPAVFLKKK